MKLLIMTSAALAATALSAGAVIISAENVTYTENFNTLAQSGAANDQTGGIFSDGWKFLEAGSSKDQLYSGGTGSSSTGDTYSFGVAGTNTVGDRALGMLQSGSVTSILGVTFTNSTGGIITQLDVAYRGETWRRAVAADTLNFSYQLGTPALNATGWTSVSDLNYTAVSGTVGILDGNAPGNFTALSTSITGLSIADGASFTFRWVDSTASSSAGMAIDDFSIAAVPEPTTAVTLMGGLGMLGLLRRRRA